MVRGMTETDVQIDGRTLRRERNRTATVDAMLELYREGHLAPSSDEIAERAGLSPRSLFRYFEDLDDLVQTAVARQQEHVGPFFPIPVSVDAPFATRVEAFVQQRMRLFDAMGAVGQVARLRAPFQPLIAAQLSQIRSALRAQISSLFAAELRALGTARAATALAALDVVCSYEGHHLMRDDQSLSRARTAAVLSATLTHLLTHPLTPLPESELS